MLILSIDSSGNGCSACVERDGAVVASAEERMERGQDQRLMPLILDVMKKAGVGFAALDRIAVTRGPGSFTGLRIGLAAARGIGLAANKPVIGIDRFSIYEKQCRKPGKDLLVVIDSKRDERYCRFYPASAPAQDPSMMTADDIAAFLHDKKNATVAGDLDSSSRANEAALCAALAARADASDPAFLPRPLYIRPPDVSIDYRIEPVQPDAAALLAKLHGESFGAAAWDEKQMQGSLVLPTTRGWSVSLRNEMVGFILCQTLPEQSEILTFCIRPSHRRRGLAERLLRQAIDEARAKGGKTVFLEVAADNEGAAQLYEKLGFQVTGRRAGYYRRAAGNVDALTFSLNS